MLLCCGFALIVHERLLQHDQGNVRCPHCEIEVRTVFIATGVVAALFFALSLVLADCLARSSHLFAFPHHHHEKPGWLGRLHNAHRSSPHELFQLVVTIGALYSWRARVGLADSRRRRGVRRGYSAETAGDFRAGRGRVASSRGRPRRETSPGRGCVASSRGAVGGARWRRSPQTVRGRSGRRDGDLWVVRSRRRRGRIA